MGEAKEPKLWNEAVIFSIRVYKLQFNDWKKLGGKDFCNLSRVCRDVLEIMLHGSFEDKQRMDMMLAKGERMLLETINKQRENHVGKS